VFAGIVKGDVGIRDPSRQAVNFSAGNGCGDPARRVHAARTENDNRRPGCNGTGHFHTSARL
jgi:hypothetical protein